MKPTWDDLRLMHIDLHYHAGTERAEYYSLEDFVAYAEAAGRRVVGITDHWGRFLGNSRKPLRHYEGSLDGFAAMAADVAQARKNHPDMILLFGPEAGFSAIFDGSVNAAFELDEVNLFLSEPDVRYDAPDRTERFLRAIEATARVREESGRPGFIVHPLRSAVNNLVGKGGVGPDGLRFPLNDPLPPLSTYADPCAHVEELFHMDLSVLARASKQYDVPFEINESTWGRMQAHNAEWFMERYLLFYRTLIDEGALIVLGSDQHCVEHPAPTAFIPASLLNLDAKDVTFLRHWIQ